MLSETVLDYKAVDIPAQLATRVCLVHGEFLSRIRFPAFRIPFQSGYSSYLPCVPVSEAPSGPTSRAAPFFIEKLPRLRMKYYGGSATLGLSTFRPSRFCAYGTLTVCGCPFVPFQAHCLLSANESIPRSSRETWYFGVATIRRE